MVFSFGLTLGRKQGHRLRWLEVNPVSCFQIWQLPKRRNSYYANKGFRLFEVQTSRDLDTLAEPLQQHLRESVAEIR